MADPVTLYHIWGCFIHMLSCLFLFIERPELDLFLDLHAVKMISTHAIGSRGIWRSIRRFWFTDTPDRLNYCCCYGNRSAFWGHNLTCLTLNNRRVHFSHHVHVYTNCDRWRWVMYSSSCTPPYARWQHAASEECGWHVVPLNTICIKVSGAHQCS